MSDGAFVLPLVTVIGAGPMGTALAGRLMRFGVPVAAIYGRTPEQAALAGSQAGVLGLCSEVPSVVPFADVAILAVADAKMGRVGSEARARGILGPKQIVLHTSGAWAAHEALSGLVGQVRAVGTLHPLASLAERAGAHERLAQAAFAVEGEPEAVNMALRLVGIMKGRPLSLTSTQMPLYHAGASLASNFVVALVNMARRVFEAAGIDSAHAVPALVPLLRSTADNLARQGLPQALTGPVARGDVATVQRHLGALEAWVPDVARVYRLLGAQVLAVAAERRPGLEETSLTQLQGLFAPAAPKPKSAVPRNKPQTPR